MITLVFLIFLSCVKDPQESTSTPMFRLTIDDTIISAKEIFADRKQRYKIDITTIEGIEIDDDKEVTVSVSDGNLIAINNLGTSSTTSQINVSMQGKKGSFYYIPPVNAQQYANLSLSIAGVVQIYNFKVIPSEPTQLILSLNPTSPTKAETMEVSAYLLNGNEQVSNDLKVFFEIYPATLEDTITAVIPPPYYSGSLYDESKQVVIAKTFLTTNKKPGKLNIIAKYINTLNQPIADTVLAEFVP